VFKDDNAVVYSRHKNEFSFHHSTSLLSYHLHTTCINGHQLS